jgi:hypothetical protein
MGALLDFHHKNAPAVHLLQTHAKFGIPFDHVCAFEISKIKTKEVCQKVPDNLMAACHWINLGIETSDPKSKMNPWKLVRENFGEDDFVVVKLDVDNGNVEEEMVKQLLEDNELVKMVDQFCFEHHVSLKEWWPHRKVSLFSLLGVIHPRVERQNRS